MKKTLVLPSILIACLVVTSCKKRDDAKEIDIKINPVGYFKGTLRDNFFGEDFPCAFLIRGNGSARSYISNSSAQTDTVNMVKKEQVWTLNVNNFHSEDVVAAAYTGKGKLDAILAVPTDSIVGVFSTNLSSYPIKLKRQ